MSNFFNKCKEILNRLSSVDVKDTSDDYTQYAGEVDIRELKLAESAVGEIVHNWDPINLSRKASVKVQNGGTRAKTGRATGSTNENAEEEAKRIKTVLSTDTLNKLARYTHKELGLSSLECGYDINNERCIMCVRIKDREKKENK